MELQAKGWLRFMRYSGNVVPVSGNDIKFLRNVFFQNGFGMIESCIKRIRNSMKQIRPVHDFDQSPFSLLDFLHLCLLYTSDAADEL